MFQAIRDRPFQRRRQVGLASRRRAINRNRRLEFEPLECRALLAASGYLQGTAFFDDNGDRVLDPGDTLKSGATIELYRQVDNTSSFVASVTTGQDGRYLFSNLPAGTYQLVEKPGLQYQSEDVQILSQVYPASRINANTIQVTILDSLQASVDIDAFFARDKWAYLQYTLFGNTIDTTLGQFPVVITGNDDAGNTVTSSFLGTCFDPYHDLTYGMNTFSVIPNPVPIGAGLGNAGELAYLHNHYAVDPATGSAIDLPTLNAVALHLATRELSIDPKTDPYTAADFFSGNFKVDSLLFLPPPPHPELSLNDFVNQAVIYANDALGKEETAIFLYPTTVLQGASQGMIAAGLFNFANAPLGVIRGEKFNDLNANGVKDDGEPKLPGWRIFLAGTDSLGNAVNLSVPTDADGAYSFTVSPGTYTVSEEHRLGWTQSYPVISGDGDWDITLVSGQESTGNDFGNFRPNILVIGPDKSPAVPQIVKVVDLNVTDPAQAVLAMITPYGNTFNGGVRIATGDLDGDGIDEIITAPGRGRAPEICVFTQTGTKRGCFYAYRKSFTGGVELAVGDVNGDGLNDIVTVPSYGQADVRVFLNPTLTLDPPTEKAFSYSFLAFPTSVISGGVVAVAANTPAGVPGILVGSGPGTKAMVQAFTYYGTQLGAPFYPFSTATTTFRGGVDLDVGLINSDDVPEVIVGAGPGGGSEVGVWTWSVAAPAFTELGDSFSAFGDTTTTHAAVRVAAVDSDGDHFTDAIVTVQGPDGNAGQIRYFNITKVSPLTVSQQTPAQDGFPGPYFVAGIQAPTAHLAPLAPLAQASEPAKPAWQNPGDPFNVDGRSGVTPIDVLLIINYINVNGPGPIATPGPGGPPIYVDVNGDDEVTALDVLLVIDFLNRQDAAGAEGEFSVWAPTVPQNGLPSAAPRFLGGSTPPDARPAAQASQSASEDRRQSIFWDETFAEGLTGELVRLDEILCGGRPISCRRS